MGWTGTPGQTYTTKTAREAVVHRELAPYKVIDVAASRNDTYVALYDHKNNRITAVVVIFSNKNGEGMYKIMDETAHPYYYNCPFYILDKLTEPAPNERAEQWRKECRKARSKNSHHKAYRIVARNPGRKSRIGISVQNGFPYRSRTIKEAPGYESESEAQKVLDTVRSELEGRRVAAWVEYV